MDAGALDYVAPLNIRRLPADGDDFMPWFAIGQHVRRPVPVPHPMLARALAGQRCWLCGRPRGEGAGTFLLTVTNALERRAYEPPSHSACAVFAARRWIPDGRLGWFNQPAGDRRLTWLGDPDDVRRGDECLRIVCLWRCRDWLALGSHFEVREPTDVAWFRAGGQWSGDVYDTREGGDARLARLAPWLP
jgi:hypothetical protein